MNRLILIGNGFDLAHGLKTSYCHFISDYLDSVTKAFALNNEYEDVLMKIKMKHSYYTISGENEIHNIADPLKRLEIIRQNSNILFSSKSNLFFNCLAKVNTMNWVDLENEYFDHLIKCKSPKGYIDTQVNLLNQQFEYLKTLLENYLLKHQNENDRSNSYNDRYTNIFIENILKNDIVLKNMDNDIKPEHLLFLSFNYTITADYYANRCGLAIPSNINYIHGELNDPSNPIIFGFGDEYDKNYLDFEELKNKELLRHIKSFGYFKTSNYHNLLRFLDASEFQVQIIGHSCGLSDRTMLKHIFEHENCLSIKIFYYQPDVNHNDFTDKTYDISRHFTDKGLLRKKLVPFERSYPL